MPCLFLLLAVAFPRVAVVLLYLFTNFFTHVYNSLVIPLLGFLFLPLTLLVYTYFLKTSPTMSVTNLVIIFVAVILDLGLIGGGTLSRRRTG